MRRQRQHYSEEFRREAVRLTESSPRPLTQIARELGVHAETLRGWTRRYGMAAAVPTAEAAPVSLEEENRRLKRENARLLEEREILKKATAFFARDAR